MRSSVIPYAFEGFFVQRGRHPHRGHLRPYPRRDYSCWGAAVRAGPCLSSREWWVLNLHLSCVSRTRRWRSHIRSAPLQRSARRRRGGWCASDPGVRVASHVLHLVARVPPASLDNLVPSRGGQSASNTNGDPGPFLRLHLRHGGFEVSSCVHLWR